jgi:hypothetical protein
MSKGSESQYSSVKKIVKPETPVETLHVTSLQGLTEQYWVRIRVSPRNPDSSNHKKQY